MRLLVVAALCLILVLCEATKGTKTKNKTENSDEESGDESDEQSGEECGTPSPGTPSPGTPSPGTPTRGTPTRGTPSPGTPSRGTPSPGTPTRGTPTRGTPAPGSRCYRCTNAATDRECNRRNETCDSECLNIVEKKFGGQFKITKKCARMQECRRGGSISTRVLCRGRVCISCCVGDLCNDKSISTGSGVTTTASPGITCPLGCKGDRGISGLPGLNGRRGYKGGPGQVGFPGISGKPGVPGDMGVPGFPGRKGMTGDYGRDGTAGVPGIKGNRGSPGLDGFAGAKGDQGVQGPKGKCDSQCNEGQGQVPASGRFVAFSGAVFKVKQADDYFTICPTKIHVNEGTGFDAATGIMKTLVPGVYYFSCVSIADGSGATPCELYKNKERIFTTARDEDATGSYPLGTNQALVTLNVLDIVQFKVKPKKTGFWSSISNKFKSPSDITINGYLLNPAD